MVYLVAIVFVLPVVTRSRREGGVPGTPCLFCVTHVGSFDPLFAIRHSRRWRMRALFHVDERHPWLRFFYQAFFRLRVARDPAVKDSLNQGALAAAVRYLQGGGSVMVFPEGNRYWEGRLYPGVAKLAHRAAVPIVPVLLGNAYVYRPGAEADPLPRMLWRILRETRRRGGVVVHFADPILPDPAAEEQEDVERMMGTIERVFGVFYQDEYGIRGPVWRAKASALTEGRER